MRGILKKDRTKIGVIYYRIILDSSEKRENRYEEDKMLDVWIYDRSYHSQK